MFTELNERVQEFLKRKASEGRDLIPEYYASDPRRVDHPAALVVHPSGTVDVCQVDYMAMERYPSVRVPVTPASTEKEIVKALMKAWAEKPEMSDYPLADDSGSSDSP